MGGEGHGGSRVVLAQLLVLVLLLVLLLLLVMLSE